VKIMSTKRTIAERHLLFSPKGEMDRRKFIVRIFEPRLVTEATANFSFDDGASICSVEFDGLNETCIDIHGIDSIHALAQAVDIDPLLRAMESKYCFYWSTGEPYFE